MIPSLEQFRQMIRTNREPEAWYDIAVDLFKEYDINTVNRIAGFMAQTGHESGDFTIMEENLNYSVDALNRVFPRYFGPGKRNAAEYARNPEKLANYVYMDEFRSPRSRLGNVNPGDGWRFRGGGIKQLTGRTNFTNFGKSIGVTAEFAADYVRTKKGAFESACWFWKTNNLSRFADRDDIDGMSKAVNGGTIGLDDRRKRYANAKRILGGSSSSITIQRGSRGELVLQVQNILNLTADGIFGPNTQRAVESWQRINRYTPNGIMDQEQINKILRRT